MSGCSYSEECPKCGSEMYCYSDSKFPESDTNECLECGYHTWVEEGNATLDEVNELREVMGMEPLNSLKEREE